MIDYSTFSTAIQSEIAPIISLGLGIVLMATGLFAAPWGVRYCVIMWDEMMGEREVRKAYENYELDPDDVPEEYRNRKWYTG